MSTKKAYRFWRGLVFPSGSANAEVDRLHASLTYWDALVANTVIPVMDQTESYDDGKVDFDTGLALLRGQLIALMTKADAADRVRLCDYVQYVDALVAANEEVRPPA